jgi:hypothetical protein
VKHQYAGQNVMLEIQFYAAAIAEPDVRPEKFERIAWVLPRELGEYDFLGANAQLVANLATGRIKPGEILEREQGGQAGLPVPPEA